MAFSTLTLTSLKSEDIEGTSKLTVSAQIRGLGRQDKPRMSLEAGMTSARWAVSAQVLE
jgi:hypothetical protein